MPSSMEWLKQRLGEGLGVDVTMFDEMYERFDVHRCGSLVAKVGGRTCGYPNLCHG